MNRSLKLTLMSAAIAVMMIPQAFAGGIPKNPECVRMAENIFTNVGKYQEKMLVSGYFYDSIVNGQTALSYYLHTVKKSPSWEKTEVCSVYYNDKGREAARVTKAIYALFEREGGQRRIPLGEFMSFFKFGGWWPGKNGD